MSWRGLHLQTPNTACLYGVFELIMSLSNFVRTANRVRIVVGSRVWTLLLMDGGFHSWSTGAGRNIDVADHAGTGFFVERLHEVNGSNGQVAGRDHQSE